MRLALASAVRPHEWLFGIYLLLTGLRLTWVLGLFTPYSLVHIALLVMGGWLIVWCERHATSMRWQLRLWFYLVAMNVVFFTMKEAIPAISTWRMDSFLEEVDAMFLGGNLSLAMEAWVHPVATEFFSFCYLLFFPYLLFSVIYYSRRDLVLFRAFMVGLFTIYGLGFMGYSWMPAAGPWLAMEAQFALPLSGGVFTDLNRQIVTSGSNGVDVFPSLHCAVSSYVLFFDRQHMRWRARLYLVPCVGLWISTIYLRYHYLIDLVFGFGLAALALWVARRELSRSEPQPTSPIP